MSSSSGALPAPPSLVADPSPRAMTHVHVMTRVQRTDNLYKERWSPTTPGAETVGVLRLAFSGFFPTRRGCSLALFYCLLLWDLRGFSR